MKNVDIWTDGACYRNPGPGGWCAIMRFGNYEKIVSGYVEKTTNNRMELKAVIEGIKALKVMCRVNVYTDSAYVADAINDSYLETWGGNGWKTTKGTKVKNIDLWSELRKLLGTQVLTFKWVPSHGTHELNIRADEIARNESRKHKRKKIMEPASGNYTIA